MKKRSQSPLAVLAPLVLAAATLSSPAQAASNLVTNGSMSSITVAANGGPSGWTLLNPTGEFSSSYSNDASPDGGTYLSINDPSYGTNAGGVKQTISGLTVGSNYTLTFYSMSNNVSASTSAYQDWLVTFGSQTQTSSLTDATAITSKTSNGLYGLKGVWVQSTMTFTATAASQLLSFTAQFLPGSAPEVLSLDGVALNQTPATPVPEPSMGLLFASGALALGLAAARRRRNQR